MLFAWPLALAFWFPNGALPSARWRPAGILAAVSCGGAMLLLLGQNPLDGPSGPVANPLGLSFDESALTPVFWALWGGVLVSLLGGVLALGRATARAARLSGGRSRGWHTGRCCCRCGSAARRCSRASRRSDRRRSCR